MSVTYLTGYYDDGSTPAPGLELPVYAVLRLARGRQNTIRLRVLRPDGTPYPVAGSTLTLTAKETTGDLTKVLTKTASADPTRGSEWAVFTVSASDLTNVPARRYVYDVALTTGAGLVHTLIGVSALTVAASVGP